MATAKLDIARELKGVATRNYSFYDSLTDEEKKVFSPYILMRFTANPSGDRDTYEWFVERTNELVNKDHFTLGTKHKELLWKLYAATGIGIPLQFQYLAAGRKEKANKIEKLLCELNPATKLSDIKVLVSLMTKSDINDIFEGLGFDKKQRKEYE